MRDDFLQKSRRERYAVRDDVSYQNTLDAAFGGRAEWRVTSVLRSKTLAQAEFTSAEHFKYRRVERAGRAEPKKKDTP